MAQTTNEPKSRGRTLLNSIGRGLAFVAVVVTLAYAIDVTQINLQTPQDPRRQEVTTRVVRALARPDFFTYNEESRAMDISIRMPCPEESRDSQISLAGRTIFLSPNCATTTQDTLQITGEGFRPNTSGIIRWHPPGVTVTTRALASFRTDGEGNFSTSFTMPDIRITDEPQRIEVEEKWTTGISGLSNASRVTIEKIIETIFLALVATIVGTVLAVPLSFLAARNLMIRVDTVLAAIMLGIIALPIGWFLGSTITGFIIDLAGQIGDSSAVLVGSGLIAVIAGWAIIRFSSPTLEDRKPTRRTQTRTFVTLLAGIFLVLFGLAALAIIGQEVGSGLEARLGSFGFLGNALFFIADAYLVLMPAFVALLLGVIGISLGSRVGEEYIIHHDAGRGRILTAISAALGTGILIYGIGSFLNWLYQFNDPLYWTLYPAIIAGVAMGVYGFLIDPERSYGIGFIIYTIVRSVLNIVRAIEPLIYVIVFAVWVGIGPFAGVIALTIHTIASLAKLYSEQVESIAEGPVEAVTATGANRLQMVAYAVVPQIVPPFIAFTLYRWDINVRFSTVIGFAGGGGIGFVLVQNINLLQYRQAAVMMLAIAVVVIVLDYISSRIRERIT
jgi:phosphonate ABC transporter permease subunit PhnE